MSSTPEHAVKEKVKAIFKRHGVWYFMPVTGGYSQNGIPDYVACFKGRFIAVECKGTDGAKPTALQLVQLARIEEAGGHTLVVTPSNIGALDVMLEALKANLPCK